MEVYAAINKVQSELSKIGLAKTKTASINGRPAYAFRGIDDVYNVIAPLLAEHKLCIIPRMLGRTVNERETGKGSVLFYVTVEAEFDFVSAIDGSKHTARTFGEAMDSGDKATNKAMSIAYKYACFQTFAIPTEEDNDPDATVQDAIKPKKDTPVRQAVNSLAKQVTQEQSLSVTDAIQGIQCCTTASELTDIKGMCLDFPARSDERYKAHKAFSDKIIELMGKCQSLADLQQLEPLCKAVDQSFLNSLRNSYGQTKARFN